jgi:exodeoxyribonuclease VII small subunit
MAEREPELGYAEALAELETILDELEDDAVDVDSLGAKVRRASALIELCRSRIESAKLEVDRIVGSLDQE